LRIAFDQAAFQYLQHRLPVYLLTLISGALLRIEVIGAHPDYASLQPLAYRYVV